MTVLVIGAGGFVGCHLVEALARGFPAMRIVAADLLPPDAAAQRLLTSLGSRAVTARIDVTDRAALRELLAAHRPEAVIHAAAVTPTPEQERADPVRVLDVNLGGLASLLKAAASAPGLRRVLFLSSTGVFGPAAGGGTLDEDADPRPASLYGIAKRAGEDLLRRWCELTGIGGASLRLGSIFGRHERPTPHRGRMSAIGRLLAAGAHERTVAVHGADVVRDWLDGDDLGAALVRVLSAPDLKAPLYHLTGERLAFRDIVAAAGEGGLRCRWVDDPGQADVAMLAGDVRAAASPARFEGAFGPLGSRPVAEAVRALAASVAGGAR